MQVNKAILLITATAALSGIGSVAKADDAWRTRRHADVEAYFKSGAESKAKDALWTSEWMFKVGVIDDGTRRDGYANYVCQMLAEHGFRGQGLSVQIVDIVKLSKAGEWVKLGNARCE